MGPGHAAPASSCLSLPHLLPAVCRPRGLRVGRSPRPGCYYPAKCRLQNDDPEDKPHIEESPSGKHSLDPNLAQHCLPTRGNSGTRRGAEVVRFPLASPAPSSAQARGPALNPVPLLLTIATPPWPIPTPTLLSSPSPKLLPASPRTLELGYGLRLLHRGSRGWGYAWR